MHNPPRLGRILIPFVTVLCALPGAARADVTVQEQTAFDLSMIKMHGTTTEMTTSDKQRRNSDNHCEGFMSLLCGNTQGGEIVRLDKDLSYSLDPKKKQYRETPFPTEAQRQAAVQQARETLEKLKQCPAPQGAAPAPDTSKCDMSPAKLDVKATDSHAMFAGHDSRLSQVTLTQSCRNRTTGDECNMVFRLDTWLTQDAIPGVDERKAFQQTYLKKMGLDAQDPVLQQQMRQFLAPYSDALGQLKARSDDLKGFPLKTVVRIAFGGEHCAAARQQQTSNSTSPGTFGDASQAAGDAAAGSATGAAGAAAGAAASNKVGNGVSGSILNSAASAFGNKLATGLFKKKAAAAQPAEAAPAADSNALPPGTVQVASITIETTAITVGPVAASEYEVPADWKRVVPKANEKEAREFSCPKPAA